MDSQKKEQNEERLDKISPPSSRTGGCQNQSPSDTTSRELRSPHPHAHYRRHPIVRTQRRQRQLPEALKSDRRSYRELIIPHSGVN